MLLLSVTLLLCCTLATASPVPVISSSSEQGSKSPQAKSSGHESPHSSHGAGVRMFDLNEHPPQSPTHWDAQVERHRDHHEPHPKEVLEARTKDGQFKRKSRKLDSRRARLRNELLNHALEKPGYYYSPRPQLKPKREPLKYNYHVTHTQTHERVIPHKTHYDKQIVHPHHDHPEQAKAYRDQVEKDFKEKKIDEATKNVLLTNSKVKEETLNHIAIGGVVENPERQEYLHHPDMHIDRLHEIVEGGHVRQFGSTTTSHDHRPGETFAVHTLSKGTHREKMDQMAIDAQADTIKHLEQIRAIPGKGRHYENEGEHMTEHHHVSDTEAPPIREWNVFQDPKEQSDGEAEGAAKAHGQGAGKGKDKGKAVKRSRSPAPGPSSSRPGKSPAHQQ